MQEDCSKEWKKEESEEIKSPAIIPLRGFCFWLIELSYQNNWVHRVLLGAS